MSFVVSPRIVLIVFVPHLVTTLVAKWQLSIVSKPHLPIPDSSTSRESSNVNPKGTLRIKSGNQTWTQRNPKDQSMLWSGTKRKWKPKKKKSKTCTQFPHFQNKIFKHFSQKKRKNTKLDEGLYQFERFHGLAYWPSTTGRSLALHERNWLGTILWRFRRCDGTSNTVLQKVLGFRCK